MPWKVLTRRAFTACCALRRSLWPKYPSLDRLIKRPWSIHTREYYSATKREEILAHAVLWMNLEDIMLKEARPNSPHIVHLYEKSRTGKSTDRKGTGGPQGLGEGEGLLNR